MAASAKMYSNALKAILNKQVDWDTDTIKIALVTSSYTFNQDTHVNFSDITNEVAAGNGYTAGGATLANCAIGSLDAANNKIVFDADDAVWSNSTITAHGAVIYDAQTGVAATSPLLAYMNFDADIVSQSGNFTVTFSSTDGVFYGTVPA